MAKQVSRRTLTTFDPRLIDFILRCTQLDEYKLDCGTFKEASALKFRLFQVRKRMKEENHPAADAVQHVTFKVEEGSSYLYVYKNDSDLISHIDKALVHLDTFSGSSGPVEQAPNLDNLLPEVEENS